MAEGRLQRTRTGESTKKQNPCERLGHAWNLHLYLHEEVCVRCELRRNPSTLKEYRIPRIAWA